MREKVGICRRHEGIACEDGSCGWCLHEKTVTMTTWEVRFVGRTSTWLVKAETFLEAVEEAKDVAKENKIPFADIRAVEYVMY